MSVNKRKEGEVEVGTQVVVNGRAGKVQKVGDNKLRVHYDDGSKAWVKQSICVISGDSHSAPPPAVHLPAVITAPTPKTPLTQATPPREAHQGYRGHAGRSGRGGHGGRTGAGGRSGGRGGGALCNLCKQPGHFSKNCPWPDGKCPHAICTHCGLKGHLAKACDFGDTPEQVNLCFEAGKRVVDVNGAIVRDFRPDEPTLARRLRAVTCEDGVGDANNTRGMEARDGHYLSALENILAVEATPPCVMLLSESGTRIEEVLDSLAKGDAKKPNKSPLAGGVLVIMGDDRGLSADHESAIETKVAEKGGKLHRVCLGGDVLFASHCIVLVNHYLDKFLHSCKLRPHREYSKREGGAVAVASRAKWEAAAATAEAVLEPKRPQGHIVAYS